MSSTAKSMYSRVAVKWCWEQRRPIHMTRWARRSFRLHSVVSSRLRSLRTTVKRSLIAFGYIHVSVDVNESEQDRMMIIVYTLHSAAHVSFASIYRIWFFFFNLENTTWKKGIVRRINTMRIYSDEYILYIWYYIGCDTMRRYVFFRKRIFNVI